jgi:hypothetical protein
LKSIFKIVSVFVMMKKLTTLLLISTLVFHTQSYGKISSPGNNPFMKNYSHNSGGQPVYKENKSLAQSVLPQNSFPIIQENNSPSLQVSSTETSITSGGKDHGDHAHVQSHSHPIPAVAPVIAPPVSGHIHGPPVHGGAYGGLNGGLYGTPHLHSGHPYIPPAVAPQRMTYQQIIEYLASNKGVDFSSILNNGSSNFLVKCKGFCDTLPPSPVCDSSNVLYRNECEAKCVHKKADKNTLRYGMCCCSDDDFSYGNGAHMLYNTGTEGNFCVSTCIFNCVGGETPIKSEHDEDYSDFEINGSLNSCANLK